MGTWRTIRRAMAAGGLCLAGMGLLACSGLPQPELGRSVASTMRNQVVNPDPTPAGPVEGLDGTMSQKAMTKYHKGLPEEKKGCNSLFSIDMGSGKDSKN